MNTELLSLTPTTDQRAKMAYVYIRQSSLMQVTRHAESTDLQYSLVERAVALGWPRERVELIDEDLGKSGAQAEARGGFQRLLAEVSLARAGLVLSFDASRLARNNRDWYQLLEVCSIFGTLIADGERLYDPRLYHDRLLLGLTGIMSEAELHHLKQRMHAGARYCQLIERMEELVKKKDEGKKRSRRRGGADNAALCRSFCSGDPRFIAGIGPAKGHGTPRQVNDAFVVGNVQRWVQRPKESVVRVWPM
jgi:hypothetical protein